MAIHHRINQAALYALLHSPTGGVAKDMLRRGLRVEAAAKRNLAGASGKPRRIDTGLLRSSISTRLVVSGGVPAARIGTGVRHARWVHFGTGIYGPRHRPITAKRGGYLVFTPKGARGKIFVRSVKGMRPNPFLSDALSAAKG